MSYKLLALEMFSEKSFDEHDVETLIGILQETDDLYTNAETESYLTDPEYDFLYLFTLSQAPTDEYFLGVGSEVRGEKVKLPFTMGSLDQVPIGTIAEWLNKYDLTWDGEFIVISDKLDGASAMVVYAADEGEFQIAYSRGDGTEGQDISRHMRKMQNCPQTVYNDGEALTVRGENIFEYASFPFLQANFKQKSGKPYKNPRNMVAGVMNAESKDEALYDYVKFVAYEIVGSDLSKQEQFRKLEELGFEVPWSLAVRGSQLTDAYLTELLERRKLQSVYEIDGIVLDVDRAEKRADMNPTRSTLNPAYTIKYKMNTDICDIPVIGVEYNPSSHGYWKPRVNLQPTEMGGVTVSWATGFNAAFIRDNKIGAGSILRVTRSGDVIPFIMGVVTAAEEAELPTDEYPWHWTVNKAGKEVDAVLNNPEDLPIIRIKRMVKFFEKIDAPLLKMGNVEKLDEAGFTKENIIAASESELVQVLGKNGTKVYEGLRKKLTDIPLHKIMGAVSVQRGMGVRRMKKIEDALGQSGLYGCTSLNEIMNIEGFDTITAEAALNVIDDFKDFYSDMQSYITIEEEVEKGTTFADQKICFSGIRDKDLAARIESLGGTIQSGVSGKTTLLVTKDVNSNTGKPKKARDLGIEIIDIEEMRKRVNNA
jgi:NAD-dependent DNA ligase